MKIIYMYFKFNSEIFQQKKLKFHHDLTDWKGETEKPTVESFFAARDYNGALTLIDFETRIKGKSDVGEQKWAALAHIRLMNYSEAMKIYEKLVEKSDADPSLYCYLGPGVMKLNMVYGKSLV